MLIFLRVLHERARTLFLFIADRKLTTCKGEAAARVCGRCLLCRVSTQNSNVLQQRQTPKLAMSTPSLYLALPPNTSAALRFRLRLCVAMEMEDPDYAGGDDVVSSHSLKKEETRCSLFVEMEACFRCATAHNVPPRCSDSTSVVSSFS